MIFSGKPFFFILAVYFAVHGILRGLLSSSFVFDESEQVIFSQRWMWGYFAQPPLFTWLVKAFFSVFGISTLTLALLKNLILFIGHMFVYASGKALFKKDLFAVFCTLSFFWIPEMAWEAQRDRMHTPILFAACSMTFYFWIKVIQTGHWRSYLGLGISFAVGVLSKYNFLLFIVGLILSGLLYKSFRKRILHPYFFLAVIMSMLLAMPHILWFFEHMDAATGSTLSKLHKNGETNLWFSGLGKLLLSSLAMAMPFVVGFLLLYPFQKPVRRDWLYFFHSFWIAVYLFLVCIILGFSFSHINPRWLLPLLFIIPFYAFLYVPAARLGSKKGTIFIGISAFFGILTLILSFFQIHGHRLTHVYSRLNYPYEEISNTLRHTRHIKKKVLIVSDDFTVAGNFKAQFPGALVFTQHTEIVLTGAANTLDQLIIVWNGKKKFPDKQYQRALRFLEKDLPTPPQQIMAVPYKGQSPQAAFEDQFHLGLAIVDIN